MSECLMLQFVWKAFLPPFIIYKLSVLSALNSTSNVVDQKSLNILSKTASGN